MVGLQGTGLSTVFPCLPGMSEQAVARHFGTCRKTVSKTPKHALPPGFRHSKPPLRPKLDPFIPTIGQILAEDKARIKRQRHTAKAPSRPIARRARVQGRDHDCHRLPPREEAPVERGLCSARPCAWSCLVDFGEALGVVSGVERKLHSCAGPCRIRAPS